MPKQDKQDNQDNPNSLDRLAQLASSASDKKRTPPIQEVRPLPSSESNKSAEEVIQQPEPERVQLNVRLPREMVQALDMALVMERRKQSRRVTQRELVEQALNAWLKENGYA